MSVTLFIPAGPTLTLAGPGATRTLAMLEAKLRRNPGDCGVDLFPMIDQQHPVTCETYSEHAVLSVPTQLRVVIPPGHFAWITPRSSSVNRMQGCLVVPGIIDAGYTGEYRIRVQVPAWQMFALTRVIDDCSLEGIALAQFIVLPFARLPARVVDEAELDRTTGRGDRGYGSTDHGGRG